MTSNDEFVKFMDLLDLDEELVDIRLKTIMERKSHTNEHLRNAIRILQYKNLITIQLGFDGENDAEFGFITKLVRDVSEENIDNVCKVIKIVLGMNKMSIVSKSEHLLQQILANIELPAQSLKGASDGDTEDEKNLYNLKLCDSILDAVISSNKKLSLPFLETPLENLLSSSDDKLRIYFLNNTVPRLFEGVVGYNILDRIWTYLKQLEVENQEKALKILSCLSEFYLPVADDKGNMKFESEMVFYYEFWSTLLYGLKSSDPAARKISIYLIKRALDCLMYFKRDLKVTSENKILFSWQHKDGKKLKENWDNFFILIDSLEEKQSNIVLPSLKLFEKLSDIESCWLNCAFKIGLKHDNTQVRLKCVEHRLKTKLESASDTVILLEALNDVNLYDLPKDCEELKMKIAEAVKDRDTFVFILKAIPKVKWCPVPFYHISEVLAKENIDLSSMDPTHLSQIVIDILKVPCNNISIRNAVKINVTFFVGKCCRSLNWKDLMNIYSLVKWNKYTAESKDRNPYINQIKSLKINDDEKEEFFKFISGSFTNIDFGLLYLMNHKEDIHIFMDTVNKIIKNIQEIVNRQYSNKVECFKQAVFTTQLFSKTINNDFQDITFKLLAECKTITQYMLSLLSSDNYLTIDEMNVIFKGFNDMINYKNVEDVELLLQMYKVSLLFLQDKDTNLDKKIFSFYVIDTLSDKLDASYKHEMLTLKQILELIKNIKFNESQNVDDVGRLRNAFYEKSCEIVFKYLRTADPKESNVIIKNNLKETVHCVEDMIECGGYGCLKWILKITNKILPEILNNEQVKFNINQFIGRMWKEIEELKSNNQYSPCIEQFVKLITQDALLKKAMYNNIVILYCTKIVEYGPLKASPLFYLVEELNKKDISEDYGQIIYVLCDILLFAPVPKKDQRIADNDAVEILQDPKFALVNKEIDHFNFTIQYSAILSLSRIKHSKIFETIVSLIISKIENHFRTKQRYHGNSQSHRLLFIGLQHLLLLSLLNLETLKSEKITWVIELLGRLPHQPSVRICLEWYIALYFYVTGTNVDAKIVEIMKSKKIPIASQFMILYSTLKHKISNKTHSKQELEFVMDTLLSHTMGQMFNVRLHAQYLATKLYNKVEKADKYAYIIEVIEKTFIESAKDKNFVKLQEDFFVQDFDIIAHLTPSFIYYFLPRYCDIGSNERVDEKYIRNITANVNEILNETDANNDFKKEWSILRKSDDEVFKLDLNRHADTNKGADDAETVGTIQKKYIPWKNMSDIDVYDSGKKKQSSSELILVASLIDKLPNLGGMARTSEVFGVNTYVVDSLRHLQDKQFQGLSVSAERWVNIEEVRPGQSLKDYLMRKKTEGYSVVAAEQTSTSCQLQRFKFPKKTLLLLGHEKEGIPCDLLPLMDHCVEIPQQGFVRSLNVHVTAAIFVWEYSRQNIL